MVRAISVDCLLHLHYKVFLTTLRQRSGIRYHASYMVRFQGAGEHKKKNMRKIITLALAMMIASICFAQKDVTKFLGIPIDGTKSAMIQKLKAKGFTYNQRKDCLEGEFNGHNVILRVVTNNNKVYRIFVEDAYGVDEANIKIRFNKLCRQFENNGKYISASFSESQEIEDDEDISFEMTVHNKRYEASFYQHDKDIWDSVKMMEYMIDKATELYSGMDLNNLTEEQDKSLTALVLLKFIEEVASKKSVWFMIDEQYGEYYILMYYDNGYNKANGEDL